MQESSRGADHGSDLHLHVSLYAGNCSEHVCTLLIGYRSSGTPGFHTFSGRVTELRAVDEGAVPASAPVTSRLFMLPVAARRWVSTDNRKARGSSSHVAPPASQTCVNWDDDMDDFMPPKNSCWALCDGLTASSTSDS